MKILIVGGGFENKGAEAMLNVVQKKLYKRLPACSFYASVSPLEAEFAYRSGIIPLFYKPSEVESLLKSMPFLKKIIEFLFSKKNTDFAKSIKVNSKSAYEIKAIKDCDAVIDISGFAYTDNASVDRLKYACSWVEFCNSYNIPYIFMPQAWGPFEKREVSHWAKKICENAQMFVSRDGESAKYLTQLLNVTDSAVKMSPDIAFCFEGAPRATGDTILKNLGITGVRPVVGLVPNMRVYERTSGKGGANEYVNLLVALVNYCIDVLNIDVLLLPNEIKVPGKTVPDDRFLCGIIYSLIQRFDHCFFLQKYCSSQELKSIYGHLDLLIASRFHSLIFALSQGTPVLALGWSHKYNELLRGFGLENYVVDHERLDTSEIMSLIDKAWQQREENLKHIRSVVPILQTQVDQLFDEVYTLIND